AVGDRDHRGVPEPLRRDGGERRHHRGAHCVQCAARVARGQSDLALQPGDRGARSLMAVYTEIPDDELAAFVASYGLGPLLSYKGIAEGVENTNYLLHTEKGPIFLTLYEKRVAPEDLPFFLGLMEHLAKAGLSCPTPVHDLEGRILRTLAGRP